MKTQEEILEKVKYTVDHAPLGFELSVYLEALTKESAIKEAKRVKTYKSDNNFLDWERALITDEDVIKAMKDYLEFAYEKAMDERGISAYRSMKQYKAWLWLIDKEDLFEDITKYEGYGIDNLDKIKYFLEDK